MFDGVHDPGVDALAGGLRGGLYLGTELFDVSKLDAIRDKYGVDLYRECYADALHEVTEVARKAVQA